MLFVTIAAMTIFVALNGRQWHQDYLDWTATRAIRVRAERIFREETGKQPPPELVHILGSGDLSHWARVYDIALTADQIVSCGLDKAVRCWSTETGESLQVMSNVDGHIAANSSLLVTIDDGQQVRVYDTATSPLKLLRQFSIAAESPIHKAFSSSLTSVLVVIYDDQPNDMQLFDLGSGTHMSTLNFVQEAKEVIVGFREDGCLLAVCKDEFLLIDSESGDIVSQWKHDPWPFDHQAAYHAIRLQDALWLIVGASTSLVWNEETQDWKEVQLNMGGTPDLVIPGRSKEAWIANAGVMMRFTMGEAKLSQTIVRTTPVMPVRCMALRRYSGGGQIFTQRAIGYGPGQIGLLDEYGRLRLPNIATDHITAVGWSYEGDLLAAGTSGGEVIVISTGSWLELQRFHAHGGSVEYVEFSPDSKALLSEEKHEIAVFDWRSAKPLVRKPHQGSSSQNATLSSADGRLLAFVLNEGWTLTDYASNTLVAKSERRAPRTQPFSSQGPVWSESEGCFVFVTKDGFCRLKLVEQDSVMGPSLETKETPDENLRYLRDLSVRDHHALLIEYEDGNSRLKIWNWRTSEEKRVELDPTGGLPSAAFAPSGRQVGAVLDSNLVLYSDAGEELSRCQIGPSQMIASAIEFSPDGRYIAIVNGNGTCYLLKNPVR
ncbi:MAG: WD40 repeat domain-containing protein [Planctomycetaceae bacterium]|nr:WD40 repeat domain-containing protein [Planctomycetaceae bacterium]MCB9940202.1 WD40 repeat domain-containing protein [Planctomycetaceae bacterium]